MKSVFKNIFPLKEMDDFYHSFNHKISEWFKTGSVYKDGEFKFTQPVDTNKENSIIFCESLKYCNLINRNAAITCVITNKDLKKNFGIQLGIVIAEDPRGEFFSLHNSLAESIDDKLSFTPSIENSAKIHPTAFVEKNCYVGKNVIVGPGAILLNNSYIEDEVIIGPNVVIGSEGLEFNKQSNGKLYKIKHMGGVYIRSGVEIMANTVVSKDVYFGFTFIGDGTKIGPLCNIAHRTSIGENSSIAGNTTIAGNAKLGSNVKIGPSVTISNGVQVGDHAKISLGSVVVKDVEAHQKITGFFAMEHLKALKANTFLLYKSS